MDDRPDPRDRPIDRLFGLATWVVVIFSLLVVIGLVLFFVLVLADNDAEAVGLVSLRVS